jgi:hypothetical protein
MSTPQYWDNGTWNTICDVCGRQFRAFQLTKRWDGLMVCAGDWETRQPQDFVRGVADTQAPPYTRPEQQDTFVFFCTQQTAQGAADYGVADCAQADIDHGVRPACTLEGSMSFASIAVAGCAIAGKTAPQLNDFY